MNSSQTKDRKPITTKMTELEEECETLKAQRDHYRERCEELEKELTEMERKLAAKFKMTDLNTDNTAIFDGESLTRLKEWQNCVEFCIGELEESEAAKGSKKQGGNVNKSVENPEAILPFSQLGLSGYLTNNHKLTQKYTEYPEPSAKK